MISVLRTRGARNAAAPLRYKLGFTRTKLFLPRHPGLPARVWAALYRSSCRTVKETLSWVRTALPQRVSRYFRIPPRGPDRFPRVAVGIAAFGMVVLLAFSAWRTYAGRVPVVAYSQVAEALEAGAVAELRSSGRVPGWWPHSGTRLAGPG